MLGIFSKKPPSLDRFPTEEWTVAKAVMDGKPMVVRLNTGARKFVAHSELGVRLGVTIAFNEPNEHGFCSADEGAQLSAIEDCLQDGLVSGRAAFPALVLTVDGRREFIFYVKDQAKASQVVDAVAAKITSHKLTYGFNDDSDWSYFVQFS